MYYCIPSDRSDGVTYHRIPEHKREEWWALAGRKDPLTNDPRICSDHFTPDCFSVGTNLSKRLKKNSKPSLRLELPVSQYKDLLTTIQENNVEVEQPPPVPTPPPQTEPLDERSQRVENRQVFKDLEEDKLQQQILDAEIDFPSSVGVQAKPKMRSRKVQIRRKTDLELKLIAEVKLLKENFSIVKDANKALKKETKRLNDFS